MFAKFDNSAVNHDACSVSYSGASGEVNSEDSHVDVGKMNMFNQCLCLLLAVYAGGPVSVSGNALIGRCPLVRERSVCAEQCSNCVARGMVCCSNGCGHQCKNPVSPAAPGLPPFCYMPAVKGRCKANKPRWFYNKMTGSCEKFMYGGCGGNNNRFLKLRACQLNCRAKLMPCRRIKCTLKCQYGKNTNKYGCPMCSCGSRLLVRWIHKPALLKSLVSSRNEAADDALDNGEIEKPSCDFLLVHNK
ncbi:PI-actitoxin-Axm2b [Lamellibrachia satsuma]|nr:PI-actitoxin-Axm2b [Lamellibrachia satsuma]